jgi:hypothetical protein
VLAGQAHLDLVGNALDALDTLDRPLRIPLLRVRADVAGQGHDPVADGDADPPVVHARLPLQLFLDVLPKLVVGLHRLLLPLVDGAVEPRGSTAKRAEAADEDLSFSPCALRCDLGCGVWRRSGGLAVTRGDRGTS